MGMKKSGFLSDEDRLRFDDIRRSSDGREWKTADVRDFLGDLEKKYETENFSLEDFLPESSRESSGMGKFRDESSYHAGRIRMLLLWMLIETAANEDEKWLSLRALQAFCWQQIERLEEQPGNDALTHLIKGNIFFFLWWILRSARRMKDFATIAKMYYRLITVIDDLKDSPIWPYIMEEDIDSDFTKPFEEILGEVADLYKRQIRVFGNHPRLLGSFSEAISLALDDEPCLILGETGTGKELIARAIHGFSLRSQNNFWAVNCGGFTPSLFASEIQGIAKGAATGVNTRLGAFLKACGRSDAKGGEFGYVVSDQKGEIKFRTLKGAYTENPTHDDLGHLGGILFLDEINSLDIGLQSLLLRIIQENEVQVVGEDRTRSFHVKLVCASNKDLLQQVKEGKFREDLYYRIARGIIEIPPLRDLKESFQEIVEFRIKELSNEVAPDRNITLSKSAMNKLRRYEWPGNHRELENVLYRAVKRMTLRNENVLKAEHIEDLLWSRKPEREINFSGLEFADVERLYMQFIQQASQGNISRASALAGVGRTTIYRLWTKYGL